LMGVINTIAHYLFEKQKEKKKASI